MKLREMRSAKTARKKAIGAANGARLAQANANLKQNKKASFADELSQSMPVLDPMEVESPVDVPLLDTTTPAGPTPAPRERILTHKLAYTDAKDAKMGSQYRACKLPEDILRSSLGHSYVDDQIIVDGLIEIARSPCDNCATRNLRFISDVRRGLGGEWVFACVGCGTERSIRRGGHLPPAGGSRGAPAEENTLRVIQAVIPIGILQTKLNYMLLYSNALLISATPGKRQRLK